MKRVTQNGWFAVAAGLITVGITVFCVYLANYLSAKHHPELWNAVSVAAAAAVALGGVAIVIGVLKPDPPVGGSTDGATLGSLMAAASHYAAVVSVPQPSSAPADQARNELLEAAKQVQKAFPKLSGAARSLAKSNSPSTAAARLAELEGIEEKLSQR